MQKIIKNGIVFIVFLMLSSSLYSLNKHIFDMDISANFGLMNGSINEYVFGEECKNTDHMVSRLDWDIYCIPFIQGDASFSFIDYIHLSLGGKIGFPSFSGYMQDYDWLNSLTSIWIDDDPTELTNYSIHNNELNLYYNWYVNLGANFSTPIKLDLIPYLGFEYDFVDMSAFDGYREYKSNNFQKGWFTGKVISYSQLFYALTFGLNLDFNYFKKVPISFGFRFSPKTGKLIAIDYHYLRKTSSYPNGTAFIDIYDKVSFFEWDLSVGYNISKHFNISLLGYIQYMPLMKGMTGMGPIDKHGNPPMQVPPSVGSEGGAGRFLYTVSLVTQFKL